MDNSLVFQQQYMMAFMALRNLENEISDREERLKELKSQILKGMEAYDLKSIDNDYVTISYVAPTPGKPALDEKAWRAEDPDGYNEVFNKYNKMAGGRKGYVRIKTK